MEVKKICVLGAGTMGSQIAQLAAQSGYEVSIRDIEDRFVQAGLNAIKGSLKKFFVDKGKMTQDEADGVFGRIKGTTDLKEAVTGVQVVIECVPEEMELKQQMFKDLGEFCAPETVLASNTSSLSITEIGSLVKQRDKVIGMHFFNPVAVMRLIEIIRTAKTSDETYEAIKDISTRFGKEIITCKDSPGFVVVRLFQILCNEAVRLVEEGVASAEDIDRGCQLGLGHAMGPLRTIDIADGVAIGVHVADYLRGELGERFAIPSLQRRMMYAGDIGVKAGRGYYDYSQQ